eukprot:5719193-Prymnesium_polylepis.1
MIAAISGSGGAVPPQTTSTILEGVGWVLCVVYLAIMASRTAPLPAWNGAAVLGAGHVVRPHGGELSFTNSSCLCACEK